METKKLCVQTHSMDESHTAENICKTLQTAVEEWKLPTKCGQPPVISDNAANTMKAAVLFESTLYVPYTQFSSTKSIES